MPFIHERMPSGRRVIVATYSGRASAMAGVWDATAITIEIARTDERARRT
jgi:hypothetical protein